MNLNRELLKYCSLFFLMSQTAPAFGADRGWLKLPPKYGPAKNPYAVPLSKDHAYLQKPKNEAADYWNLSSFYESQFNEFSCSVASVAMVINGVTRASRELKADDINVTQQKILEKVKVVSWKERVTPGGFKGGYGLSLKQLHEALTETLNQFDIKGYKVEKFETKDTNVPTLQKFRDALNANEKSGKDYIIIHFLQDQATDNPVGPYAHISPIGAYDAQNKRVLVMDVDREWYEPYWISDERLLYAMSRETKVYGYGGFIWLKPISE